MTPAFEMRGSMLTGTAEHRLVSIATALDVTSPAPATDVAALVEQAERMCFVLDALQRPHQVNRQNRLNGVELPSVS